MNIGPRQLYILYCCYSSLENPTSYHDWEHSSNILVVKFLRSKFRIVLGFLPQPAPGCTVLSHGLPLFVLWFVTLIVHLTQRPANISRRPSTMRAIVITASEAIEPPILAIAALQEL